MAAAGIAPLTFTCSDLEVDSYLLPVASYFGDIQANRYRKMKKIVPLGVEMEMCLASLGNISEGSIRIVETRSEIDTNSP